MNKATRLMTLVGVLLLAGCDQTPLPEVTTGEVVFEFEGTLGQEPVSLEAGKNGAFQEISVVQAENGLYQFTGVLGPASCEDCPDQVRLTFRDSELSAEGALLPSLRSPAARKYDFFREEHLKHL